MRHSENPFGFIERYRRQVVVAALLVFGTILLACGFDAITNSSAPHVEPSLPPLSEWIKVRCQYQNTVTGESHDKVVVAPREEGGVGYQERSLCYKKDAEYKQAIDDLRSGKVSPDDISIGTSGGLVTQADIGY